MPWNQKHMTFASYIVANMLFALFIPIGLLLCLLHFSGEVIEALGKNTQCLADDGLELINKVAF